MRENYNHYGRNNTLTVSTNQSNQVITIAEAISRFLSVTSVSENHSQDTIKTRRCRLEQMSNFFMSQGVEDITELTQLMLDNYLYEYALTRKVSTVNTTKRVFMVFFSWAASYLELNLRVRPNAIKTAKRPRQYPQALDIELVRSVISQTENTQDRLMIAFNTETGLRISEMVKVKVTDIDYDSIRVRGKGDNDRIVNITTRLADAIQSFLAENNHEYLFEHQHPGWAGKMTAGAARSRMQRCFMDIAGKHIYPRQFRHTMAVELLLDGCDIMTVKDQLGHAHITTTQIYLQLTDKQRKKSYKKHMISTI